MYMIQRPNAITLLDFSPGGARSRLEPFYEQDELLRGKSYKIVKYGYPFHGRA